jgi:ubiquinone/menaquinone biosynthesis C-methylase UbiE
MQNKSLVIEDRSCSSCPKYSFCKGDQPGDKETRGALRTCQRTIEKIYYNEIYDKDILEVGCGSTKKGGFIKQIVESNNCRWTGIDISETDLATYVCGVEKMPFDDKSFDWVIGSQTLEHWKNTKKALKEIRRVLRNDGKVSLTAPIHLHGGKNFVRGELDAIANTIDKSGFNIETFETWKKNAADLAASELNNYSKKKLRKAGITKHDGIKQYVIHCILAKKERKMSNNFLKKFFSPRPKVVKLSSYIGTAKGRNMMVVGAGGTLREYEKQIKSFIKNNDVMTIGINYMTGFCIPDYHFWTNKQRYRDLGQCISPHSKMMFGYSMPVKLIRKHHQGDYITVDYTKKGADKVDYRDGKIYGNFRTAGCLAIMIAHLLGAENIYVVGMDGFTLHGRDEIEEGNKNQHCYGKGYTDDATWEQCVEKDRIVYENLNEIDNFGVKFKIITPTKFEKFYKDMKEL